MPEPNRALATPQRREMMSQKMSYKRFLRALVVFAMLALALIPARTSAIGMPPSEPALASALTTAFTYQGQLRLNGNPVNTTCTIAFGLYDAATGGTQVGSTLNQSISVANGLFTTRLDFGDVFQGDARWLEITPDCGAGAVKLTPRQPLTAVPYALFSAAPWTTSGSNLSYSAGNVGIGTTSPSANLEVVGTTAEIIATGYGSVGQFIGQRAGGTSGAETAVTTGAELAWFGARGYDGTGFTGSRAAIIMNASQNWYGAGHGTDIAFGTTENGTTTRTERMRITEAGNVGIGTTTPAAKLTVLTRPNTWGFETSDGTITLRAGTGLSDGFLGTTSNHALNLVVNSTSRMTINQNGNVGIGTTAPAQKLTVWTAPNTYGIEHTDGNVSLTTLTGNTAGGG